MIHYISASVAPLYLHFTLHFTVSLASTYNMKKAYCFPLNILLIMNFFDDIVSQSHKPHYETLWSHSKEVLISVPFQNEQWLLCWGEIIRKIDYVVLFWASYWQFTLSESFRLEKNTQAWECSKYIHTTYTTKSTNKSKYVYRRVWILPFYLAMFCFANQGL